MKSLTLYFVRHAPVIGQSGIAYGRDAAIDDQCHELFDAAAQKLPQNCDLWIASVFPRASRTAEILRTRLNIHTPLLINLAFNEQNFGRLVGQRKTDIRNNPANQSYLANMLDVAPPEGEAIQDMVTRVGNGIEKLCGAMRAQNKDEAIVVCHGGVIRAVDHLIYDRDFNLQMKVPYLSVHKFER